MGAWELGEFAQLAQLDGAQKPRLQGVIIGRGSGWGFTPVVEVSATISLVGMEGIKLHNQPQRRIDRTRSVGIPIPALSSH